MAEHIASRKMYVLVFVSLILLTALTTAVAYVNLGPFNTVVALLIAMVKLLRMRTAVLVAPNLTAR